MTPEEKVAHYRAGRYTFEARYIITSAGWSEDDWIRYIDAHGVWNPQPPKTRELLGHTWDLQPNGNYRRRGAKVE
jgi:hypothetical protein